MVLAALEKDNILAERMSVGETLLVTAPNAIARPVDHPKWNATFLSTLEKLSAQRPPRWAIGASDDDLDEDDWDEDDDDES